MAELEILIKEIKRGSIRAEEMLKTAILNLIKENKTLAEQVKNNDINHFITYLKSINK
jgi:hypothetical protein